MKVVFKCSFDDLITSECNTLLQLSNCEPLLPQEPSSSLRMETNQASAPLQADPSQLQWFEITTLLISFILILRPTNSSIKNLYGR